MQPTLFIDRDGTLIDEPKTDFQIDSLEKLKFEPNVIPAMLKLKEKYRFVMVSNQDGLGTDSFPQADFDKPHNAMMALFKSQGIEFDDVLICPHKPEDHCQCRKPQTKLLKKYIEEKLFDPAHSFVIGDRATDVQLAENLGIRAIQYHPQQMPWELIAEKLLGEAVVISATAHHVLPKWCVKPKKPILKCKYGWMKPELTKSKPALAFSIICLTKSPLTADSA